MDVEPKTPTADGGSHVSAKKSRVDAPADIKIAMINNGLQKTDDVNGLVLFRFCVLGSWK